MNQQKRVAKTLPSNLREFGKEYFPHRLTASLSIFHQSLVSDLDHFNSHRGQKYSYIAPRGSAKSTWSTIINTIWLAITRREKYIIIISDVQPVANKFLREIKYEIESNQKLREDYEDCRPGEVWATETIELINGVRIESVGKGGKIRGRIHQGMRPTLVVLDDPQGLDDAHSEDRMAGDMEFLNSDVLKAGEPDTNYLMLGTALADNCMVCQCARTPGWKSHKYKSLITEPTNMHLWSQWRELLYRHDDPQRDEKAREWYLQHRSGEGGMDFGAKVLWPERVPLFDLMHKRYSEGERAFLSEEQGEPMPPGDAEFPMQCFDWPGFWVKEWPVDITISAHACDPSKGKESKQGDFQALGRGACNRAGIIYVQAWLEKMDSQAFSDFLVDRYFEAPSEAIGIETNNFQELLIIPIEIAAKAKSASLRLPIVPLINTVNKQVRIRRLTNYLTLRMFRFLDTPGTRMLVEQLKKFPFAEHDDGPDMLEMLLRVLIQLSQVKRIP